MLPKKRRISRKEFGDIISKGRKYNSQHLSLYLLKDISPPPVHESKFSFSVSKKISPLAVKRNKYRRQGYSVVEKYLDNIGPGFFCFFSFKKSSEPLNFSVLEKEIRELLSISLVLK